MTEVRMNRMTEVRMNCAVPRHAFSHDRGQHSAFTKSYRIQSLNTPRYFLGSGNVHIVVVMGLINLVKTVMVIFTDKRSTKKNLKEVIMKLSQYFAAFYQVPHLFAQMIEF